MTTCNRYPHIQKKVIDKFKERHGVRLMEEIHHESIDLRTEIGLIVEDTIAAAFRNRYD